MVVVLIIAAVAIGAIVSSSKKRSARSSNNGGIPKSSHKAAVNGAMYRAREATWQTMEKARQHAQETQRLAERQRAASAEAHRRFMQWRPR